jgi:hypothetical protein
MKIILLFFIKGDDSTLEAIIFTRYTDKGVYKPLIKVSGLSADAGKESISNKEMNNTIATLLNLYASSLKCFS